MAQHTPDHRTTTIQRDGVWYDFCYSCQRELGPMATDLTLEQSLSLTPDDMVMVGRVDRRREPCFNCGAMTTFWVDEDGTPRDTQPVDGLAAAWREVEAAIPEGMEGPRIGPLWIVDDSKKFTAHRVPGSYEARATSEDGGSYIQGTGDSPEAALRELLKNLEA